MAEKQLLDVLIPQISTDHSFVRHNSYNIAGATVSIAPEGLAKKRVWNRKYPIAIKLPSQSILATVSPSSSSDNLDPGNGVESEKTNVNTSSGAAASSTSTSTSGNAEKKVEYKKEINREDCSHKVIYLFSRTDREKDDW